MSVPFSAVSQSTNSSWFSRTSVESRSTSGRSSNHWKLFRKEVLAPHHIRIVDSTIGEAIPESIITWIEANRTNTARFQKQKRAFRKQVGNGRGFGSSALFPQEVLPSNDARPFLARCMVPTLSEEALPEKVVGRAGAAIQKSSLSLPRPGLGCGFSSSAFAPEEVNCMPSWLLATGTTVHFETGSISTGTALYCPFMSYERAFSQHDNGLEVASNQCAIDGAWACRALQMLYAKATGEEEADDTFPNPVSFSCAIDNDVAIINYHWVDHAQTYCMAPLVRFELAKDDHFDQFLIWSEAIGQWALTHLLPEIKKAISLLSDYVSALPALVGSLKGLDTNRAKEEEGLVSALKLTYDNIPWRYANSDCSPVSSSTASWGSPMVNEAIFSKFTYPIIPQPVLPPLPVLPGSITIPKAPGSVCSDSRVGSKGVRFAQQPTKQTSPPSAKAPPTKNALNAGDYRQNSELVLKKRMGHAMDEIQELQSQIATLKQELSGSTSCIQNELSGLRKTMTTVIRKERMTPQKQRSPLRTDMANVMLTHAEHRMNIQKGISVVTTPTDPKARPVHWPSPVSGRVRTPSGLANVLSLDTNVEPISAANSVDSATSTHAPIECKSPITIFSPTIINMHGPYEPEETEDGALIRVPQHNSNLWSQVAATHVLSALVPSAMLRVILIGCIIDYCLLSMNGGRAPSVTQYIAHLLETAVY